MINIKEELQDYPPISLTDIENSGVQVPDNIKNSVILYNKALESLRMDSEDMAIIELKKAISMNPTFYEAMNLLGLCYSYTDDKAKAVEMFQKVIAAENNSIKALKYMRLLNSSDEAVSSQARPRRKTGVKKSEVRAENSLPDNPVKRNLKTVLIREVPKYLAGAVAGALIIMAVNLTNPRVVEPQVPDNTQEEIKRLSEEAELYKSKNEKLEADYNTAVKDLEAANASIDYYKSVIKLYEIESLIAKKDYEGAADMLVLMKTVEFRGQEKEKFDKMYQDTMPLAAKKLYEEGFVLANTRKEYQEALKKFNKVQMYNIDYEKMDAVLYYTGKCYQLLNDSRNALATYQKLLDQYPESTYVRYANTRIRELTQIP